ncbi:hypothetical protein ACFU5V_26330, partial [Rhodococcus sp. NPDC057529]
MDDGEVSGTRPEGERRRGELRIYLGAAPGVGKTFAMLGEAHRRRERGCDVVAAVVETPHHNHPAEQPRGPETTSPPILAPPGPPK